MNRLNSSGSRTVRLRGIAIIAGVAAGLATGGGLPGAEPAPAPSDSGSAQETPGNAPESNSRLAEPEVDPAALRRGRILFLQCTACHSTKQGEEHKVGPNLYDFLGAKAAGKPDYTYSEPLAQSGVVWSRENLSRFLESPNSLVPGTTMAFIGVRENADRLALIAYLEKETQ